MHYISHRYRNKEKDREPPKDGLAIQIRDKPIQ